VSDQQPPSSPPPPFEQQQWLHDIVREDAHRAHDQNTQFFEKVNEAAIRNADATLRATLLINGGAAVSVLAFLGGLVSQGRITISQLSDVSSSLVWFAYGVTASVIGMALSYFTNYVTAGHAASHEKWWQHPYLRPGPNTPSYAKAKRIFHVLALIVSLGSIVLFVWGMFDVRSSIVRLGTPNNIAPHTDTQNPAK
jgi:hypothetical protein